VNRQPGRIRIVVLHGIGRQTEGYWLHLESGLTREFRNRNILDWSIHGFLYSDIAELHQDRYWNALDKKTVSMDRFRELFLYYFGDAGAYGTRPGDKQGNYRKIHGRLEKRLAEVISGMPQNGFLVVLAQSFGSHVFSNFYWDYTKKLVKPRRLKGLPGKFRLFITTGCNIPVIVAGLEHAEPFTRPNKDFQWINIYDKDDILGWPLRPLGGGFGMSDWIEDRIIDAGLPLVSHMNYWKSKNSLKIIADAVAEAQRRNLSG